MSSRLLLNYFLYKFLNDQFEKNIKEADLKLHKNAPKLQGNDWSQVYRELDESTQQKLQMIAAQKGIQLQPQHLISYLFSLKNDDHFAAIFDDTLQSIARYNADRYSLKTATGAKIELFDRLSNYIQDPSRKNDFCRAVISKISEGKLGYTEEGFDFYAAIFEYLIKDYNANSGGKYAEYYTPYAVARIIANILVDKNYESVSVYDPSAGSGSLLMSIAQQIGVDNCTIYTQDISQKSSHLLRLNLLLNRLQSSIQNVAQGNTMTTPYHRDRNQLKTFDFVVSNPPFKLDFSEDKATLEAEEHKMRFFAGVPSVPKTKKESMAIYQLFIQHIIHSLKDGGRAAIVLPAGFITAQSGIDKKIRQYIIDNKMLLGVVSMPSNIFATTGTNVSILFLQKGLDVNEVILIDASNLGKKVKEGKNQKTVLSNDEEQQIIDAFKNCETIENFSIKVSFDEIKNKNYSLSAGQYFEVMIKHEEITQDEFNQTMQGFETDLKKMFDESKDLEKQILDDFKSLRLEC